MEVSTNGAVEVLFDAKGSEAGYEMRRGTNGWEVVPVKTPFGLSLNNRYFWAFREPGPELGISVWLNRSASDALTPGKSIGAEVGGAHYAAVSAAIQRFEKRMREDAKLARLADKALKQLNNV